jgi:putative ABC transport system substrate-binding protein
MFDMRRRDFVALLGGAAAEWPMAARAQQSERVRRVGVLVGSAGDDPEMKGRLEGFRQELELLGWSEGRNIRIDIRFALAPSADQAHRLAKELVALRPEVILAQSTAVTVALQHETSAIPIVFVNIADPIGSGFIASLARPGGNLTGLQLFEASVVGKWLAMLKEIAPQIARAALVINPKTASYYHYFVHAAQAAAPSLAIDPILTPVENDAADIERAIESFARVPSGSLVLLPDNTISVHRDLIIALAARHRLPAVYSIRDYVVAGGLMCYATSRVEQFRQAASYVDRILRGARPAELPVQAPTKYETVLNLKTAKALGLIVPPGMLVAADEVIE